MIAHSTVVGRPGGLFEPASGAVREEVLSIAPSTEWLISEIEQLWVIEGWEGHPAESEVAVDLDTAIAAVQFACLLPRSMPVPEVTSDPDGEISFDWFGSEGKMFSVSLNRNRRIAYAGRFGEMSKVHGIEQLSEVCPPEILRGIAKATS
jgi:hypothetical protein